MRQQSDVFTVRQTRIPTNIFIGFLVSSGVIAALQFSGICLVLVTEAWASITNTGLKAFFLDKNWFPTIGQFGSAPMMLSSVVVAILAVLIAAPFGIGLAAFNNFFANPVLATIIRRLLNVATAIPSIVFGLWGLMAVVPLIVLIEPPGVSLLAAVVILAMMIIPTLALLADLILDQVPQAHVRAAIALGARKETNVLLIMRIASHGLFGAIIFSLCRAIGETMVVVMLAGNIVAWPNSPLTQVRVLTANIALEMPYAAGLHRSALFLGALELVVIVAVFTFVGMWLMDRGTERARS